MSFDLTLWHDPRLRRFDKAMARLDAARPLNAAARRRLAELTDALLALPGVRWSVDPAVDEAHSTLGVALTGPDVEDHVGAILSLARARGFAVWDPQAGVVSYADGSTSREEQAPDGVHEGVAICLRELAAGPPPGEVRDILDALLQFTLADSPDVAAAARLVVPALRGYAADDTPEPLRLAARNALFDLRTDLEAQGIEDIDA